VPHGRNIEEERTEVVSENYGFEASVCLSRGDGESIGLRVNTCSTPFPVMTVGPLSIFGSDLASTLRTLADRIDELMASHEVIERAESLAVASS
jgi:hypothetical protein